MIRDELAAHEVVAGLRAVHPLALTNGLLCSHPHVLGEAAAKFALLVVMQGNLSTQTLRAFDEAETDKLIESL